jgi:hypothetical protein
MSWSLTGTAFSHARRLSASEKFLASAARVKLAHAGGRIEGGGDEILAIVQGQAKRKRQEGRVRS